MITQNALITIETIQRQRQTAIQQLIKVQINEYLSNFNNFGFKQIANFCLFFVMFTAVGGRFEQ